MIIKTFFDNIFISIELFIRDIKLKKYNKKMKKKYLDYEDDEYNCGNLKFIWGIKSSDELSHSCASFNTMNDLDIIYNRETKLYILSIETIYAFDNYESEIKYLEFLLYKFAEFLKENNYTIPQQDLNLIDTFSMNPWKAETLSELYVNFKIFVNGFKALHNFY